MRSNLSNKRNARILESYSSRDEIQKLRRELAESRKFNLSTMVRVIDRLPAPNTPVLVHSNGYIIPAMYHEGKFKKINFWAGEGLNFSSVIDSVTHWRYEYETEHKEEPKNTTCCICGSPSDKDICNNCYSTHFALF